MNPLPHRDTHSPAWRLNALLVHIWCRFYFWLFATSKWCSGIAWAMAKSICARVYSLSPAWWVFLLVVFRFLSSFLHFSIAFGCGFLAIVAYIVHIYNVACVCCMYVAAQNKLRINTLENKGTAESRISLTSQYMYTWKKKMKLKEGKQRMMKTIPRVDAMHVLNIHFFLVCCCCCWESNALGRRTHLTLL